MADNSKMLRRVDAARFLTEHGFPTATATLSKLASIGGGPKFVRYSRFPLYAQEDLLDWARSRCSKRVASTSELAAIGR